MKVLFISYFYPPCNIVASDRVESFVNKFISNGHEVTVITRHWTGNEKTWDEFMGDSRESEIKIETQTHFKKIILPYKKSIHLKFLNQYLSHLKIVRFLYLFILKIIFKIMDFEFDMKNCIQNYYPEIYDENFDLVVTSCNPFNQIEVLEKYTSKAKTILDLRDWYDNKFLKTTYHPSIKERVLQYPYSFYFKKYLPTFAAITTASHSINALIRPLNKNNTIVLNGFNSFLESKIASDRFGIIVLGNLFMEQNLPFLIDIFNHFLKKHPKAELQFIGIKRNATVYNYLKQNLTANNVIYTDHLMQSEMNSYLSKSELLYYIGWKGYQGVYSGKIFTYLSAQKNILVAPSDHDVLDKLLLETNAGFSAGTQDEALDYLEKKYQEWNEKGFCTFDGKTNEISKYTRDAQADIFYNEVLKRIM